MSDSTMARKSRPLWAWLPRRILETTGVVMIAGMALLTLADVFMRTVFNAPVQGAYDVNVYWFMVIITAVGLWYAEVNRDHIRVGLISERATGKASLVLDVLISLVSIGFALIMGWYALGYAQLMTQTQEYVGVDRVQVWPVRYVVVIGLFAYAIALTIHLWQRLSGREEAVDESDEEDL